MTGSPSAVMRRGKEKNAGCRCAGWLERYLTARSLLFAALYGATKKMILVSDMPAVLRQHFCSPSLSLKLDVAAGYACVFASRRETKTLAAIPTRTSEISMTKEPMPFRAGVGQMLSYPRVSASGLPVAGLSVGGGCEKMLAERGNRKRFGRTRMWEKELAERETEKNCS